MHLTALQALALVVLTIGLLSVLIVVCAALVQRVKEGRRYDE